MHKRVDIETSTENNERPFRAVTCFGVTKAYRTMNELHKALNFIFGVNGWFVANRRITGSF
jgi:hypothetical protein